MNNTIPIYQPDLTGNEQKYVDECIASTWISSKGAFIEKFENAFARFTGTNHAVTTTNGTTALHLALLALDVGEGDEVIVPSFTYIASVNAITYVGAIPIFADSLSDTWQLDPADVTRKVTSKTKAIMAVHLYGQACDMDAITVIAKKHNLLVIEDCAEAIGTQYKGAHVGNFSDVATFSFFGNKTITTGEGGMVITNDQALRDKVAHYKGQGLARDREYWHDVIGYNYRMTNICAALGVAQMERIDTFIDRKRQIAALYRKQLAGARVTFQAESEDTVHTYWMFSILVNGPQDRDALRDHLKEKGIETRPTFYPIHTMPIYPNQETLPVAENIAARGMNLPSWPGLSNEQVIHVCEEIKSFLGERK